MSETYTFISICMMSFLFLCVVLAVTIITINSCIYVARILQIREIAERILSGYSSFETRLERNISPDSENPGYEMIPWIQ